MHTHQMMVFTWKQLPKKAKKHIKAWVQAHRDYVDTMIALELREISPDEDDALNPNDIRAQMAYRYWWRGVQAALACNKWLPNGGGEKFGRWMLDREPGQQFPDPLWTEHNKNWEDLSEEEYLNQMMEIPT